MTFSGNGDQKHTFIFIEVALQPCRWIGCQRQKSHIPQLWLPRKQIWFCTNPLQNIYESLVICPSLCNMNMTRLICSLSIVCWFEDLFRAAANNYFDHIEKKIQFESRITLTGNWSYQTSATGGVNCTTWFKVSIMMALKPKFDVWEWILFW